jgi:hypothetical protein
MKDTNKPFEVNIDLDQSSVQAGGKLTGRLVLPQEARSDKAAIKSIRIFFQGQEKTQVSYRETSQNHSGPEYQNHSYTATAKEKSEICSHLLVENIYDKSKAILPTTSFQFRVPSHLPASVTLGFPDIKVGLIVKKKADYAVISYKVKVEIQRRGLFKGTLTYDREIQVVEKSPSAVTIGSPWETIPEIKGPQKRLFGKAKEPAKIYVAARLPNGTHVEAGQNLPVDVSVVNNSKTEIEKVTVALIAASSWKARGHKQTCETDVTSKSFGWLGDAVMKPPPESVGQTQNSAKLAAKMKQELDAATHRQILTVPTSCHADFSRQLMSTHHFLLVQVKAKKWFGPSNVKIPIVIHPPPRQSPPPQAPPLPVAPSSVSAASPIVVQATAVSAHDASVAMPVAATAYPDKLSPTPTIYAATPVAVSAATPMAPASSNQPTQGFHPLIEKKWAVRPFGKAILAPRELDFLPGWQSKLCVPWE